MFCYAYVHQHLGWNQNSRLDLLRGLFLHHTFRIDADHENTGDKSIHNGHYYSDKAPGIVLLAAPAYAVALRVINSFEIPVDSPRGWLIQSWITTAGSVGIITALGGVAMFAFLCRFVGQKYSFPTALAVFLGSAPFPYATMLFSHAAVIGLLCIALWAIADETFLARMTRGSVFLSPTGGEVCGEGARWVRRYLLAGLCCGLAISSEYTAAIAAGGVLALGFLSGFKRGCILALGAMPPLLLIPAYNWACFGSPLAFGYHNLALPEFQEMNKGLFGITFPPKLSSAYLILISPERGLFFWTPFFLLAFFGLNRLFNACEPLFWCSVVVATLQVICISGYYMPSGGSALGPRHLAPASPFLTLCAALGFASNPRLGATLGYYSLMLTGLGTVTDAMPPGAISNVLEFYIGRLSGQQSAYNLWTQVGIPVGLSLLLATVGIFGPFIWACRQDICSGWSTSPPSTS